MGSGIEDKKENRNNFCKNKRVKKLINETFPGELKRTKNASLLYRGRAGSLSRSNQGKNRKPKRIRTDNEIRESNYKLARNRSVRFPSETKEQLLMIPQKFRQPKELTKAELKPLNPKQEFDVITSRVEFYLLRGIVNPQRISGLLTDVSVAKVKQCIDSVHNRWKIRGAGKNLLELKGQLLARYDALSEEGFNLYNDENLDISRRLDGLKIAAAAIKDLGALLGIGQCDVQVPVNTSIENVKSTVSKIQKNKELRHIVVEFSDKLEQKRVERLERGTGACK